MSQLQGVMQFDRQFLCKQLRLLLMNSSKGPSMQKETHLFSLVLLYSTYSNLCDLFTQFLDKNGMAQCPHILQQNNFPCTCPFLSGHYHINPSTFKINRHEGFYHLILDEVSSMFHVIKIYANLPFFPA